MTESTTRDPVKLAMDLYAMSVGAADSWRSKGEPGLELFWLLDACRHAISCVVLGCPDPVSGANHLLAQYAETPLKRTACVFEHLFRDTPSAPEGSPPPEIGDLNLLAHALTLVVPTEEALTVCRLLDRPTVVAFFQHDALRKDYARGLACLARGESFEPKQRRYSGYDHHLSLYLPLIASISRGLPLAGALAAVDASFSTRNRDRRLVGDGIDGDGVLTVKWDLRRASLLSIARARGAV
jgi:hypothetical protein